MTKPVLLIDGDIICYQICSSREEETFWGEDKYGHDLWTLHSVPKDCLTGVKDRIEQLKRGFKTDKAVLVFSSKKNFRKDLLSEYKAHRKSQRKPLALGYTKDKISELYDTRVEENLEADDLLAILSTEPTKEQRIIISIDKDFETVPGLIYNPNKDKSYTYREVTDEQAKFNFYKQILEGDRADNYKGLPGVGPVAAEKILKKKGDMLQNMLDAFSKKGYNKVYTEMQGRMARLLQHGEYNFKTKEIKLWSI